MKKLVSYLSIMAVVGLFPAIGFANEPNIESEVTLNASCAPWDGEAYEVSFALPANPDFKDAHFRAMIWGKGIEALKAGESFDIDGTGSMDGTGDATLYNPPVNGKVNYAPIPVKAHLQFLEKKDTLTEQVGFGSWIITIIMPPPSKQTYLYKISPILGSGRALCG